MERKTSLKENGQASKGKKAEKRDKAENKRQENDAVEIRNFLFTDNKPGSTISSERMFDLLVMDHHTLNISFVDGDPIGIHCLCCQAKCTVSSIDRHIHKKNHLDALSTYRYVRTLVDLPPKPFVVEKIGDFLELEFSRTMDVVNSRKDIFETIEARIQEKLTAMFNVRYVLKMVDSYYWIDMDECDLNMTLSLNGVDATSSLMLSLMNILISFSEVASVEPHIYEGGDVRITFTWCGNQPCVIALLSAAQTHLDNILGQFNEIDERCEKLSLLFRKWAHVCRLHYFSACDWPLYTFHILTVHFLQRAYDGAVLPIFNASFEKTRASWKSTNVANIATLWSQMLTFHFHKLYTGKELVVTITRNTSDYKGNRLFIDEPGFGDELSSQKAIWGGAQKCLANCLLATAVYYSVPQCAEGPVFGGIRPNVNKIPKFPHYSDFVATQRKLTSYIARLISLIDANYKPEDSDPKMYLEKIWDMRKTYVNLCALNIDDFRHFQGRAKPKKLAYEKSFFFIEDALCLVDRLDPSSLHYDFSAFVNQRAAADAGGICKHCSKEGHRSDTCPLLTLVPLSCVPLVDKTLAETVDRVCYELFSTTLPTMEHTSIRERLVSELQALIQAKFPKATLHLYGSSCNGFGVRSSDLDISISMPGKYNSEVILPAVNRVVKKCNHLSQINFIRKARVPIVKFVHRPTHLEVDISLQNDSAVENTRLLKTYSEIDVRVKILGIMVKWFAYATNIGSAADGGLSSYCHVLMMLYFLQRCSPPIIPNLQALPKDEPLPEQLLNGWNTYFYDKPDNVPLIWPGYKKNDKSVGQLWIEYLIFYSEKFDWENHVVSVRSEDVVWKIDKKWFSKSLAVEDPFITNLNLCQSLSKLGFVQVLKAFRSARLIFTSNKLTPPNNGVHSVSSYHEKLVKMTGNRPNKPKRDLLPLQVTKQANKTSSILQSQKEAYNAFLKSAGKH